MKKYLLLLALVTIFTSEAYAYEIIATDEVMYVFQNSEFKKDSHVYKVIYEVDEKNRTITAKEEIDLKTGETYKNETTYEIVSPPTQEAWFKNSFLKATRINPTLATVETIVFCDGKFHYSKTHDKYINLSSGVYEIKF